MKKLVVLLMVTLIALTGCSKSPSQKFMQKYEQQVAQLKDEYNKLQNRQQYMMFLQKAKPVFNEMDSAFSKSFSQEALGLYSGIAAMVGQFPKAASAFNVMLAKTSQIENDSLYLTAAELYIYADSMDKALPYLEKSLEFKNSTDPRKKDYLFSIAAEEVMKKEGKEKALDLIAKVKENLGSMANRIADKEKSIKMLDMPAPQIEKVKKWINVRSLTSRSLKNKVYLIDFWATWCAPCRISIPHMKSLAEKYGTNKSFKLIGITKLYKNYRDEMQNLGEVSPKKETSLIKEFCKRQGMKYPVAICEDETNHNAFGVSGIPAFYLVGKDGRVKKMWVGSSDQNFKEMDKAIARELGM